VIAKDLKMPEGIALAPKTIPFGIELSIEALCAIRLYYEII
jgi:hypothetical protein